MTRRSCSSRSDLTSQRRRRCCRRRSSTLPGHCPLARRFRRIRNSTCPWGPPRQRWYRWTKGLPCSRASPRNSLSRGRWRRRRLPGCSRDPVSCNGSNVHSHPPTNILASRAAPASGADFRPTRARATRRRRRIGRQVGRDEPERSQGTRGSHPCVDLQEDGGFSTGSLRP